MKIILSFSGGMDSTTLLYKLINEGHEVLCVSFSYGSKHNSQENKCAKLICQNLGVELIEVDLSFVGKLFKSNLLKSGGEIPKAEYNETSITKTVVPGRNTIFMSILAGLAESKEASHIAISNHAGDHAVYPDCRPQWVAAMGLTIFLGTSNQVELLAPFTNINKGKICKIGKKLNIPYEKTWSCYEGGEIHCGACSTCIDRKAAFSYANLKDPTSYKTKSTQS